MNDLPESADTLEDARTLALHYQKCAAECGSKSMRYVWALMILREWALGQNYDARALITVRDWIDSGMNGPIPWPGGLFFAEWATERGLSNVDGYVGMRLTAKLVPAL